MKRGKRGDVGGGRRQKRERRRIIEVKNSQLGKHKRDERRDETRGEALSPPSSLHIIQQGCLRNDVKPEFWLYERL